MPNAAGSVNVNLSMNAVTFTQGIKNAQAELDKFAGKAKQAGHTTVSTMQASSASIRLLEGGMTNNIRAVERFITTIPGVGKALQVAFPLVGALAFGSLIASSIEKVTKFIETANKMPRAITQGFESLNLSQKSSTDSLNVLTDKLNDAHAAFAHKPSDNGLKTGIDEARESADKFAESVINANDKVNELLSKNHLSAWAILLGKAGTGNVDDAEKEYTKNQDHQAYLYATAAPGSKQQSDAKDTMGSLTSGFLADRQRDRDQKAGNKNAGNTYDASIAADEGIITTLKNQQAQDKAVTANDSAKAQAAQDEAQKKATEAAKQAAEKRLQAMIANLENEKLQGAVSVKAVYDYWAARRTAFSTGSTQYNEVVAKQTQAALEAASKAHETITRAIADQKRSRADDAVTGPEILNRYSEASHQDAMKASGEQSQGYVDNNQLAIDNAHNDAKEKEAKLNDEAGNSITRYAAAMQIANAHAQEFVTIQEALQGILDTRLADQKANPSAETDRAVTAAQAGLANAQSQRGIQIQTDNNNISGRDTSGLVGAADALNDFVRASRDASSQMREFTSNLISGFNSTTIQALTTRSTGLQNRMAFGNYGAGLARSVAGMGLNKAEGSVLGAFGVSGAAKLGSTPGSAMYVRMADKVESGVKTAGSFLSNLFGGGKGPGQSGLNSAMGIATSASPLSLLGSATTALLPMLAGGGPINGPAIVGEQGPELFMPSSAGHIVPNHMLSSVSTGHTINIDASGSTNPAATQVAVQRGIQAAAPHLMAGSVHAMTDMRKRRPTSAR